MSVVLPASGCEIIANVRRRVIWDSSVAWAFGAPWAEWLEEVFELAAVVIGDTNLNGWGR